jgi:hypothetical protein
MPSCTAISTKQFSRLLAFRQGPAVIDARIDPQLLPDSLQGTISQRVYDNVAEIRAANAMPVKAFPRIIELACL